MDFQVLWVCSSREIVIGSSGIHNSRAKIIMGVVMVYGSRKVVVGYVDMHSGCSVGHYGLETEIPSLFWEGDFLVLDKEVKTLSSGQNNHKHQDKLKYDKAGAHAYVFSDVSQGSRRGWNYIRDYNDWVKQD
jgi:hypothetical protein